MQKSRNGSSSPKTQAANIAEPDSSTGRCFWKLWQSCYSRKRKNSLRSSPWRWGNCCALQWKKLKRAPAGADGARRKVRLHPRGQALTCRGSEIAGGEGAGRAGEDDEKSVLELGGSDGFHVMSSAEFEGALIIACKARSIAAVQSRLAAIRLL